MALLDNETLQSLLRQAWRPRTLPPDLRTQTMSMALDALRTAHNRKARDNARKLAAALYISLFALLLMIVLSLAGTARLTLPSHTHWLVLIALGIASITGCLLAVMFASRWCRIMGLPRTLQWLPITSIIGTIFIALNMLSTPVYNTASPHLEVMGSRAGSDVTASHVQSSLDIVSRALTRTMTVSESQAWLNAQLPHDVERAWFVTPQGLIALSSITTANEISRSVIDLISVAQTLPATLTSATLRDIALSGVYTPGISTQAAVFSDTPLVLLALVREAMRGLSPAEAGSYIMTQLVRHTDGTLAGIAALTIRQPSSTPPGIPLTLITLTYILAGFVAISMSWAAWVFMIERAKSRRTRRAYPGRWASLTALLLPVGLLIYLARRDSR